jgi:signal transduction histidine kinase/CheY-like chemotaxis protein
MLSNLFRTRLFPPANWDTPSSDELRLHIVEECLLTFLVATSLAGVAMWLFGQPFTIVDMLLSYGPFMLVNIAALWLARRGRVQLAVLLYTVVLAVMQGGSVLVFGGVRIHIVISMVNLILLLGVAVGSSAALLMLVFVVVLFSFSHWLADGIPIIAIHVPITPMMIFISTTATLVATGFVVASMLRVFWAHVEHSAEVMSDLKLARDDLDERHQSAVELSALARTMLVLEDSDRMSEPLVRALASMEATEAALLLDAQFQTLATHGEMGVEMDKIRDILSESPSRQDYRPTRLTGSPVQLYGLHLDSPAGLLGYLLLRTRGDALLPESAHVFIAAAAQVMVSARLRVASEERFRRTQRMETLGQFTGGIAHDFNNLLTTILGSAELALMTLEDSNFKPEEVGEHLEVTRTGALQAGALVERLLSFAKRATRERTPFNLTDYIRSQETFLSRTAGEGIVTTFTYTADAAWVHADPIEIQQVLLNLLANARDAMGLKGAIEITLARRDDAHLMIEVADSGPGIPLAERERIFKPFYTTRAEGSGLGLGLATVSSILDSAGGRVEVKDSSLGGAAFIAHWPLYTGEVIEPHTADEALDYTAESAVVLIVDDDNLVRETIAGMLTALGHQAVQAQGVTEALELLATTPEVAMVITDFMMPGLNGRDLIGAMRDGGDDRPAILVSGYEESALLEGKSTHEPQARLGKPFTLGELRVTLGRVLQPRADQPARATVVSNEAA